jgi:hypothetical protein
MILLPKKFFVQGSMELGFFSVNDNAIFSIGVDFEK